MPCSWTLSNNCTSKQILSFFRLPLGFQLPFLVMLKFIGTFPSHFFRGCLFVLDLYDETKKDAILYYPHSLISFQSTDCSSLSSSAYNIYLTYSSVNLKLNFFKTFWDFSTLNNGNIFSMWILDVYGYSYSRINMIPRGENDNITTPQRTRPNFSLSSRLLLFNRTLNGWHLDPVVVLTRHQP